MHSFIETSIFYPIRTVYYWQKCYWHW